MIDWVSVEELDWSAVSQVLITAEHLWCDFKCRPWAKNSSPNTYIHTLYGQCQGKGDRGLRCRVERKEILYSCHKTQNNIIFNCCLGKQRFQSWPAVSADHTSCRISVLRVLQHKGIEGKIIMHDSSTEHEQEQNNLLTTRNRKTDIYGSGGMSDRWGRVSSWSVPSRGTISTDCPDHELPNMTGQHRQQEEPRRHPEPWQTKVLGHPLL